MENVKRIPVETIYNLMMAVFTKLGVPENEAKICSDVLIASDLRGIESHGIGRLKMYYDRIKLGIQKPTTKIDVVRDFAATAVWDGNHGMGHVIAFKAMQTAIDKAKKYGMGSVAVRNSTHFGIAGYYARMAAKENMVGMAFTNARPSIAPLFGVQPMMGTNPIAFAAPSDQSFCFLFDGATSIIQRGKVEVLDRENKPTPSGCVIDDNGKYVTDSKQILIDMVKNKASLVALGGRTEETGGHKGYGLAAIVEILSAAFQGGSFMHMLSGFDENGNRIPYHLGHFFMAINTEAFMGIDEFKKITGKIMTNLQNSKKEEGKEKIYIAGEKEFLNEKKIERIGVPVNPALERNIKIMIEELNLEGFEI